MFEFALLGIGVGAVYALIAQGLVLVYRGSGVVNLAQAAIGGCGAYMFLELKASGWPLLPAALVGVAFSGVIGGLFAGLVMRRLQQASALTRLIATIALLTMLISAAQLRYPTGELTFPHVQILPTRQLSILGTLVGEDRVLLLAIAVVLTATLWLIYKYTRFGLATTAVAENPRTAAALGVNPQRVATVNWIAGALLSGVAVILISPILTLAPSSVALLILPAIAASMIGRLRSFPLTLVGGVAVGVVQSVTIKYVQATGWATSAPFLLMIVYLVVTGTGLPLRSYVLERLPAIGSGRVPPVRIALGIGVVLAVIAFTDANWAAALTTSMAFAIIGLSVVLVTGYAGQLSLAQLVIAGLGALAAAKLYAEHGVAFLPSAAFGTAVALVIGVIVGLPALRTRGANLAIVTLGLALACESIIFSNANYTGGFTGIALPPPSLLGLSIDPINHPERYAIFALAMLVLLALMLANVRRSRTGRRLIAVRSNERAASALGISVMGTKMYAFALGSAIASVGGVVLAFQQTTVLFGSAFTTFGSLTVVVLTVLGGVGYIMGAGLGALLAVGGVGSYISTSIFGSATWLPFVGSAGLLFILVSDPHGQAERVAVLYQLLERKARSRMFHRRGAEPQKDLPAPAPDLERVTPRVLSADGVCARFGGVTALADVAVVVDPGTILGVIGPNGAGKTTLIDVLSGFVPRATGDVRLDGARITDWSPARRARSGLGRSFQSLELFDEMTVRENLLAACDGRGALSGVADLMRPGSRALSSAAAAAVYEFDLGEVLDALPPTLSAGRRRLVGIARAIAAEPSILLLDEPAAGLNEHETAELGHLVQRLAREWGIGILLVEHDMSIVMSICDRILALDNGRVIAEGTPLEIQEDRRVVSAYLGAPAGDADSRVAVTAGLGAEEPER